MLAGNVVALLSPLVLTPIFTLIFGVDKYDWVSMAEIRKGDDHDLAAAADMDLDLVPGEGHATESDMAVEQAKLLRASKIAKGMTVLLTIVLLVLWPMPLYGTGYVFNKSFFSGWVIVGIIWLIGSLLCVGVYPVWEGRNELIYTCKAVYLDITGKQKPIKHTHSEGAYTEGKDAGTETPPVSESKEIPIVSEKKA
jgi:hypothetical protein